jgi:Rod binding domain-containing protein
MDVMPIRPAAAAATDAADPARTNKIADAARQFEALLIEQLLRGARGGEEGWMGGKSDGASDIATEFAEQQLAGAMSAQGGLGLASLVVSGLDRAGR